MTMGKQEFVNEIIYSSFFLLVSFWMRFIIAHFFPFISLCRFFVVHVKHFNNIFTQQTAMKNGYKLISTYERIARQIIEENERKMENLKYKI